MGVAGGDLSGSYPDPVIASRAVTNAKLSHHSLTVNPGSGLSGGGSVALGAKTSLAVAGGGIGTPQLAAGSVTTPKFAAGAEAPDAAQLAGAPPSDYGAVLSGRVNTLSTAGLAIDFGAASGVSTANGTESTVSTLSPADDLLARDLSVQLTAAPGGSLSTRSLTLLVDGAATSLSCAIGGAGTTCSATGPVKVPASSTLSIADAIGPSGAAAADARFALRLTPS